MHSPKLGSTKLNFVVASRRSIGKPGDLRVQ
jgi:hypothetical protein